MPQGENSKTFAGRIVCLWRALASLTLVAVLGILVYAGIRFLPNAPRTYDTMEDHFKYGSLGGDLLTGIPLQLWQAMPLVCADTLQQVAGERLVPDYTDRVAFYYGDERDYERRQALSREGYKALGFLYERDANGREHDVPVGMSVRRSLSLERTYMNCAVCHTSTVRTSKDAEPELVLGMPANLFNLYNFEHFILQCASKGRETQLPQLDFISEIDSLTDELDFIDRYLVYPLAIWGIQDAMFFLDNVAGFSVRQPHWGPGRNDTFTNNKIFLYGYDWRSDLPDWWRTGEVDPEGIGTVDFPSTWLQGQRKQRDDGHPMQLHWDGNNDRVEERNLNAALATSSIPPLIDHQALECIEQWMETLEPPPYPLTINEALAAQGRPLYQRYCSDCHGENGRDFSGIYVGHVTPIDIINTDPYRLNNYTRTLAVNMGLTYAEQERRVGAHDCPGGMRYQPDEEDQQYTSYRYQHYRKTRGYANMPLDGIWARAPYLHNGSVPTMMDLLRPAAERPVRFYRGNDVIDGRNLGFVATRAADSNGRKYFLFDTTIPGNGNQGHEGEAFGTELSYGEKQALVEYLKTF